MKWHYDLPSEGGFPCIIVCKDSTVFKATYYKSKRKFEIGELLHIDATDVLCWATLEETYDDACRTMFSHDSDTDVYCDKKSERILVGKINVPKEFIFDSLFTKQGIYNKEVKFKEGEVWPLSIEVCRSSFPKVVPHVHVKLSDNGRVLYDTRYSLIDGGIFPNDPYLTPNVFSALNDWMHDTTNHKDKYNTDKPITGFEHCLDQLYSWQKDLILQNTLNEVPKFCPLGVTTKLMI